MKSKNLERIYKLSVLLALIVLSLYFAGNIIFPILFGLFFSLSLLNASRWIEKWGIPRFISAFVLVTLLTFGLIALLTYISFEGYKLVNTLNNAAVGRRLGFIETIGSWFTESTSVEIPNEEAYNTITQKLIGYSGTILSSTYGALKSTFVFLSLVPIYAVLFLTYRGRMRSFLNQLFNKQNSKNGKQIVEDMAEMMQSYLVGLLIVVSVVGILYAIGLSIIGVRFALLLALVTAVLIVIPYIGAILGALLPTLVALLTMDSAWYGFAVFTLYIGIQLLEGYVLTPFIIGKNVDLNPLVIILGMVVLGAIGGILAIILAIPILASVKIAFSNVDGLKPFAELMEESNK